MDVTGITDSTIEIGGDNNSTQTFTIESSKAWKITPAEGDTWYTFSPSAGDPNSGSPTTVTMTADLNSGFRRFGSFEIGAADDSETPIEVAVNQQLATIGSITWDLSTPIAWYFSVDKQASTGYDYDFASTSVWSSTETNVLPAEDGPGYMTFTHVYDSEDGDCKRAFEAKSGEPYISGAWPGAYWTYTVPVSSVPAGTKVQLTAISRTSGTGQKYWILEYLDGSEWLPATTTITEIDSATNEEVTYTHAHDNTDELPIDVTVTLANAISNGSIKFRHTCVANSQASGSGALSNPNTGTHRFRGEDSFEGCSPKIQIVE